MSIHAGMRGAMVVVLAHSGERVRAATAVGVRARKVRRDSVARSGHDVMCRRGLIKIPLHSVANKDGNARSAYVESPAHLVNCTSGQCRSSRRCCSRWCCGCNRGFTGRRNNTTLKAHRLCSARHPVNHHGIRVAVVVVTAWANVVCARSPSSVPDTAVLRARRCRGW